MASLIGKEIGKYRITERIGRGGMAEVYLGVHVLLDRLVAIKVLHGYLLEGGDSIERFKREAKAVANLRHPNIVQVYDFDIQDDIIFMVMEYIDGTNLQQELVELGGEGERFPIKQMGSIINDIAGALDYAHSQGMLHRDVKPSNILIDKDGKAYLTDFGIARIVSDHRLTATGTLVGTPAYMSPEQGRGGELTEESDIYSLGIVAFEMLTGQVPYDAQTPIGIVHKQISEPVPDISKLVDDVPLPAQEVIDRALAKSPEVRYSSAEELTRALRIALEALESSELISAIPASTEVDEEILSAPTVAMQDVSAPGEFDQPTAIMQGEEKQEQEEEASPTEREPEAPQAAAKDSVRKIPAWGVIIAGVFLVGIAAVVLTQVIDFSKPGPEPEPSQISSLISEVPINTQVEPTKTTHVEPTATIHVEPTASSNFITESVEVVFDVDHKEDGLFLLSGLDQDTEFVMVAGDQGEAWRSGNGKILPSNDGNTMEDKFIDFNIDENYIFQVPLGTPVRIEIEYLDTGVDLFSVEYDAHPGRKLDNEVYKWLDVVQKTGSGEFKAAGFILDDAFFANPVGDIDIRIGDLTDGAETIRRVTVKLFPSMSGEEYFFEGETLQNQGKHKQALEYFDLALAAGYETAYLYHLQAFANRDIGKTDEALNALDKAVAINPTDPLIRTTRGELIWEEFGDAENAQLEFDLAINNNEDYPRPYNSRGLFYLQTGKYDLCIEDYTIFISLDPSNPYGPLERGDCYAGLGDVDLTRQDYETFLSLSEGDPELKDLRERVQLWLDEN